MHSSYIFNKEILLYCVGYFEKMYEIAGNVYNNLFADV